jgi:Tfp pilus assembly protein PilN
VPDDAFLNTIPLYLNSKPEDSFIAIYSNDEYCKIGIVTNRKLHAVFRFAPCKISHIEFYIARIERYFKTTCPHIHFPSQCFLIGAETGMVSDRYSISPLPVIIGKRNITDEEELKAIGVALVKENGEVPLFTGATSQSSHRHVRAVSYIGALLVVGTAIIALVFLYTANIVANKNLRSYESQYNNMFSNNVSIKSIVARNESLAKAILFLEQEMSTYTNWTQLLNVLGTEKSDDILFDKLGSEPVADKKISAVRIAITGCARNEVAVTGLISRLQKVGFLSKVTLASLAKSEKNVNTNDFKILCTMNVKK